jgi:hypothetical protein
MGESTHTITVQVNTADVETGLARCVELGERFRAVWGDQPLPTAIERLEFNPGDYVVLRYDEQLDQDAIEAIKEQVRTILPGVKPVVLTGALRLEGVLATSDGEEG